MWLACKARTVEQAIEGVPVNDELILKRGQNRSCALRIFVTKPYASAGHSLDNDELGQAFKNVGDIKDILPSGLGRVRKAAARQTVHSRSQIRRSNIEFYSENLKLGDNLRWLGIYIYIYR